MGFKTEIDPADQACSRWIRLRDRACLRCGSSVRFNDKGLPVSHQASHFQGRRKENTRFSETNLCTLCGGCHSYLTANPAEHYAWQVARLGQEEIDKVILASNFYCKKDRKAQEIYWKQKLKQDFNIG